MTPATPASIAEIYPRYSQRLLRVLLADYEETVAQYLSRTHRGHYQLGQMFEHELLEFDLHPEDVIIAGTLFFKGASFAKRHAHPSVDASTQISIEEVHRQPHPAFADSCRQPHSFFENYVSPLINARWDGCSCVIFLASDLRCLKPILQERGIKVVMMKHPSLAHNPGAMWRYLAFNFKCRAVYFIDTDSAFNVKRIRHLLDLLEQSPKTALVRPLQATGRGGHMALILGSGFMVRPAAVDFDVAESMLGYIILNLLTEDRPATFSHEPRHGRTAPSPPLPDCEYSGPNPIHRVPLKCFPYYGLDERWLKEVVYYHFSNGRMATQIQHYNPEDIFQSLDLAYQRENGNRLIESAPASRPTLTETP